MTKEEIALPPLPPHRLGERWPHHVVWGYEDMVAFARAAVLLDRQRRAAPTYGSIADRAADGKDAGMWQAAPGAEPVGVAETIMGTAGALTMAAFHAKDVPAGTKLYASPPAPSAVPVDVDALRAERDAFFAEATRLAGLVDAYMITEMRAAPSAEPVQTIIALKSDEQASLRPGAYQVLTSAVRPSAEPTDHTAAMRQALEALEERYIGALRDNAVDALRAALEGEAK
jgi:hypothetical protein